MKKTALVIMAAGVGSRFGNGIKQLAPVGPNGEIIMDYSIRDALEAGFNKIVFIIRKDLEEEFKSTIGARVEKIAEVAYAYQEMEKLPEGFVKPADRTKPWGTGHAVICAREFLTEPFAVINADDYYGKEAFVKLHDFLVSETEETADFTMAMAGFVLKNTVSENGTVTRGICVENEDGMLTQVIETSGIAMDQGKVVCENPQVQEWISPESKVSMNMWAGYPEFIDYLEEGFVRFLEDESGNPLKKEYLIPVIVDGLLKKNQAAVKVIPTSDKWIGITYHQDLEAARTNFAAMIKDKIYPEKLWN